MTFTHVLLEVYCSKLDPKLNETCNKEGAPGYSCLAEGCPNVSYTYADHEIAYTGKLGHTSDTQSFIGFGGEMLPDDADEQEEIRLKKVWEEICKKKIAEAYEEYMSGLYSDYKNREG